MMTIRSQYEADIDALHHKLRRMGLRVYSSITRAIQSLNDNDKARARQVIAKDQLINQLETDINESVVLLILKQQPVASDLRLVLAALKIANELERIGDNAANIAHIRLRTRIDDAYVLKRLEAMGQLSLLMLEDLDTANKDKELSLVEEIIQRDQDIDDLYTHIINITYLIDNDPYVAGQAHLAARSLERIGDHIGNIAENILYYYTGELNN
ncbi:MULTISPECIES: phosphate signaling complex protein PhoU [Staphylococcus]|uniref:Phosphate-specific transport system accessory protein PhoU n=1 Tax=Staphylococcus pettenkoferi TaxID=170573 RepID=A0A2N6QJX4_9STAP|nr:MULTISPECIES: phosphate signaling complex protein PhoU [Staphylococcus]MBX8992546.1 phosphate signaling complex protein PhoU [Staphylococcus pettenkoferi]MCI2790352.1 phosphate signaling complex protein PhoU [Staphylococcus pettenkoferi]MCY1566014.1 phosphate signaling complex protein PhoU [Staphylococcus pettenkoferi]MCY1587109.1 phosphate signaling complex protein PhoU [Staphylococcus pettenkoferi]MCY1603707.1 phosphate signaling complex protein PhoU [Staphylococcus pettenkoferi]